MKVQVERRNGKHVCALELDNKATLEDLQKAFDEKCHYYPERQRWTKTDGMVLNDGLLCGQGISDNSVLLFKDLGVQISWRLVFVIEYAGPIFLVPLFYFGVYQCHLHATVTQQLAFWLLMIHFVKRELETLFIHRFSHGTMPIIRVPINCLHYWVLCGVAVSYYLFHPLYKGPFDYKLGTEEGIWFSKSNTPSGSPLAYVLFAIMLVFEYCNFQTHVILRNLRPRNSKERAIPYGWGFNQVSLANYTWEIASWITFAILVNCLTAWVFLIVASLQMMQWALKKHRKYRHEFKDYPRERKAIFPYIL